jgi:UDP:flavonoid glycosyltransferase YjiC (YdhE family)
MTNQKIKTFVFAPACYNLAETTRMLEIAKAMARHSRMRETITIRFMSEGGEFEGLIRDEGFALDTIEPRVTPEKIAQIAAVNDQEKIGTIYSWREILEKVRGDTAFLAAVKPAAVVTGSYVSIPLSCRVLSIPLVWTIQSTWLKGFFASGAGVTDSIPSGIVKSVVDFALLEAIRFWMWFGFIRPINRAARHLGVKPFRPVFTYFDGDLVLVAEPKGFTDIALPPHHVYCGPLIARQPFALPEEIKTVPRDLPLVFFAMGSSGVPEIVANIIEGFAGKPYRVIAPVKRLIARLPHVRVPDNVIVTDWVPALEVNKMADIAVIHGGIGTVMTAALAGKPVVGVGMQPEQVANLACLVRKGFAIRIRKTRNPSMKICIAIDRLLGDEDAKRRAIEFSQLMAKWDGPKIAADLLLERYGN